MLKFAIPAVAALGLIAVAAQSQATNSEAQIGVAPVAWHLSHEGEMAKLAYGVANSDQLALMITCEPGQAEAVLYGEALPAGPRLQQASLTAADIDPLDGGLADELRLPMDHPALRQLARRGEMAVEGEAGLVRLSASHEERGLIDRFFSYCGSANA